MPFDLAQQDERRPRRVVDDAFEPAAVAVARAGEPTPVCAVNDTLPPGARAPALAVFAFGAAPCAYARARFELAEVAGAVLLPEVDVGTNSFDPSSPRNRTCYMYRARAGADVEPVARDAHAGGDVLIVVCQYAIRAERAHAWCEAVLGTCLLYTSPSPRD